MIRTLVQLAGERIRHGSIIRGTVYYGGSSIVCQGLRFVGILVSTRFIEPDQFGKFATAVMLIGLCGLGREFGQNSAFLSCTRSDPAYARFHFLLSVILSFFVVLLVASSILVLPGLSDLRQAILFLCLIVLIEGAYVTPLMIAQKRFEFRPLAMIEVAATVAWLLCVGLGSKWYPVTLTLIVARLIESLVRGGCLLIWRYRDLMQGEITREVRSYFGRFARLLTPQAWVENLFGNLDVLLLQFFTTKTDLGVYERTQQVVRIPVSTSVNLVDRVAGAAYSRDQGSVPLLRHSLARFMLFIWLGTVAGLGIVQLFLWFFAEPLLGANWKNAVSSLWIWALPFCLFRPIVWNYNLFFQATARPRQLLLSLVGMLVVLSIIGVIVTPQLGSRGIFVALGCSYFFTLVAQTCWCIKMLRELPGPPTSRRDRSDELVPG
jgi:O-antigen/teichoic acid export membrane protein